MPPTVSRSVQSHEDGTTKSPWFRVSALPRDIPVRLWLGEGPVIGRRVMFRRETCYEVRRTTGWTRLPDHAHAQPSLWQPIDPAAWTMGLPRPATLQPDIDWKSAPPQPRPRTRGVDVDGVTYSQPGEITLEEAEKRIVRAIRTEQVMSVPSRAGIRVSAGLSNLADWGKSVHELGKDATSEAPRWTPTPRDVSDAEVWMQYFAKLNPPEYELRYGITVDMEFGPCDRRPNRLQAVLVWRAMQPPVTWKQIAEAIGVTSHTRAQQVYEEALVEIRKGANGQPVLERLGAADQLALLRERNRLERLRRGDATV